MKDRIFWGENRVGEVLMEYRRDGLPAGADAITSVPAGTGGASTSSAV